MAGAASVAAGTKEGHVVRRCREDEFAVVHEIITDAAGAYRGVIPADRWHEPYMSEDELRGEMASGVVFWGYEEDGRLLGVMGVQDVDAPDTDAPDPDPDVTLVRHAYVLTSHRRRGIGGRLLEHLRGVATRPVLVGTWAAADWAIRFYEKHGFRLVSPEEKNRLLRRYWDIPARQVETSVVLASCKWHSPATK